MSKRTSLFLVPAIVAAFAAGWWLAPSTDTSNHEAHPETATAAETVWTCSMHPQIRQPHPGDCPICGMDLIPLTHDDSVDAGPNEPPQLRLSERSVALMNLQTIPVIRQAAHAQLRLPGRIAVDETRLSVATAWFAGRVDRLFINHTGQRVEAGQPLMELYSPELFSTQQELIQATRAHSAREDSNTRQTLERARERLRLLGLSPAHIEAIEANDRPSTHLTVTAPASGFVIERQISIGQYVERGTPLFTLADLSEVWVELEAYESELPFLRLGQAASIELTARPGETFQGTIAFIDPQVDPSTRTARVRINLNNDSFLLKPGMLATGSVMAPFEPDHNPLVIPVSAPLHTGKRALVYVQIPHSEGPIFEPREVVLGPRLGEVYPVLEGLAEDERVVVNGQFKLDSELQIRGRPSMMAPATPEASGPSRSDPRDPPAQASFAETVTAAFASELLPLVEGYLLLTNGLADDDLDHAQKGLRQQQQTLADIGEHRLSGDAHVSWMHHYNELESILNDMKASDSLEGLRSRLQELTLILERIYVNFGSGILPPLNRAFCPMVDGDSIGTWLQRGEEVRNPYWGEAMLGCGEVFDQLGSTSGTKQ